MSFVLLGILNAQAAGGGAGAFDYLDTVELANNALTIDITGLDSYTDYQHLQFRMVTKSAISFATSTYNLNFRINNDTASNYYSTSLTSTGSSASGNTQWNNNRGFLPSGLPANGSGNENYFAGGILDILDFNNTSKSKTLRSLHGTAALEEKVSMTSIQWNSTSAISSISFFDAGDYDILAKSKISIYGMRTA